MSQIVEPQDSGAASGLKLLRQRSQGAGALSDSHSTAEGSGAETSTTESASPPKVQENVGPAEWDVTRNKWKEGPIGRLQMVLPTVTHLIAGTVGGALATTGYGVGKLREAAGGKKAVDSSAFRAGFAAWMWSNGIFPHVTYQPLGPLERLRELYGDALTTEPKAEDMSLTPVIVCNHISYLDGVVLASVFGAPKIVAKAGVRQTPILGRLMEDLEVVFVDRQDKDSRQATIKAISDHGHGWVPGGRPLLIFPEGTTTNGDSILDFKKGAFVSGKPVRPVLIVYTGEFDAATTNYRMTEKGPVKYTDAEWAVQFLGHFMHAIHIRVLPPYVPSLEESQQPEVFAQGVRAVMLEEYQKMKQELKAASEARHERAHRLSPFQLFEVPRIAARRLQGTVESWTQLGLSSLASCATRSKTAE